MMNTGQRDWIYVGNCPVCMCGLRRIRACAGAGNLEADSQRHGYVLCDECEALWLTPEQASPMEFSHAEGPLCPVCSEPLYGPQARWATVTDVERLGWKERCIIENRHESAETSKLLELEDLTTDLDAVAQPEDTGDNAIAANALDAAQHLAEAASQFDSGTEDEQAEPRPGC